MAETQGTEPCKADDLDRKNSAVNAGLPWSREPGAVVLDFNALVKEGADLWDGVKFGRFLGAGVQARVFEIITADGRPTNQVIKVAHADLAHKIINNPVIWISMEREWEMGTQLRAALQSSDGRLRGFMRVDDCVVMMTKKSARFTGMIMEKMQGWDVHSRITDPTFHNIHYIREMLFQSFTSLDRAQRALGFHHADLGMRNIMEHYPQLYAEEEARVAESAASIAEAARAERAMRESNASGRRAFSLARQGSGGSSASARKQGGSDRGSRPGSRGGEQQPNGEQRSGEQRSGEQPSDQGRGDSPPAAPDSRVEALSSTPSVASFAGTTVSISSSSLPSTADPAADARALLVAVSEAAGAAGDPPSVGEPSIEAAVWSSPDLRGSADEEGGAAGAGRAAHLPETGAPRPRDEPRPAPVRGAMRAVPGFNALEDGSHLPLGPVVEFKIIDYGVAALSQTLAKAAGGQAHRRTFERIRHVLAARKVLFLSPQGPRPPTESIELMTSERAVGKATHAWHLVPIPGSLRRFRVKQTPVGAVPVPSEASLTRATSPLQAGGAALLPALSRLRELQNDEQVRTTCFVATRSKSRAGEVEVNPEASISNVGKVAMGPVERMYRNFWRRKGDVFHILLSLCMTLDGRVWPKRDEEDVKDFISLVFHCTGVEMRAKFCDAPEDGARGVYGYGAKKQGFLKRMLSKTEAPAPAPFAKPHSENPVTCAPWAKAPRKKRYFGLRSLRGRVWRRAGIAIKAHIYPYNSGMLAGEALVSPFFGNAQVAHAKYPVSVDTVFPRTG